MRTVRAWSPLLALSALLVAFGFLPVAVGGSCSFVTTHGVSMAPRFHTGDLAIVRGERTYRVGDVVAYRSEQLHTVVLHRIIAMADGRYTFKGDNNSWVDQERPRTSQLLGTLVARIPRGGTWLNRLRQPPVLGGLVAALLCAAGVGRATRRGGDPQHTRAGLLPPGERSTRRPVMSRHARGTAHPRGPRAAGTGPAWQGPALLCLCVVALGAALSTAAWTRPAARRAAGPGTAGQQMAFSYTAAVRSSAAYDTRVITSPDPVFRKVTDIVDVRYAYRGAAGTCEVTVGLSSSSGWHSERALRGPSPLADGQSGTVRLDLRSLDARAQAAAAATGVPTGPVTVTITPRVTLSGGQPFRPSLTLTLTPLRLSASGPLTVSPATRDTAVVPAGRIRVGRWTISTDAARWLSTSLLGAGLLVGAALAVGARTLRRLPEAAALRRRYRSLLVHVQRLDLSRFDHVFDVVDMQTLARVAARDGQLIAHCTDESREAFVVCLGDHAYRYRANADQPSSAQRVG